MCALTLFGQLAGSVVGACRWNYPFTVVNVNVWVVMRIFSYGIAKRAQARKGDPARRSTDIPRYISISLMSTMLADPYRCCKM